MENQSIDEAAIVSPPIEVLPGYVAQQPPPHNNQIHLQTDFTTPPPTHSYGIWLQAYPNSWQTQFGMVSPVPHANSTVTDTTACNNNPPAFSSSSNSTTYSTYRLPLARWGSFNNSARQRPYQYGNTPSNNYPRQFPQNATGNSFANSSQNPQTPSSSSTQNWPQFNQRPRFIPRQHMRMNRPHSSVQNQSNGTNQETNAVTECKKRKRRLKSQQSGAPQRAQKLWNREDAVKAIAAEMELRTPRTNQQIMIRFPDHEITREIVQNFHTDIKSVHFHAPCNPRYCYVQVQPSANIENVANALNETFFQHEKLKIEIKESQPEEKILPECIDPYTLYVGNLPANITSNAVKDEFPKAIRVDIGFGKKMKNTRYAFLKFSNAEDAIQAYKEKYNLVIDSRSVVLRFRRKQNGNPPVQVDKLPNEKNEFDIQSLPKKIKKEPIEKNIDEYEPDSINASRVVKSEIIEEDEYEPDSEYESMPYTDDINIKSECPDYEDDYDEQYYEEEDTDISYAFQRNETGVEDKNINKKPDDEDEFEMPYSFIPKKKVQSENNKDITLPKTGEINDDGSDKEDQRWNNLSDDDTDDDGGAKYNWGGLYEHNRI
ncbi:uncharacterized protein LOC132936367 [Metopolophium dirhodum]|uniref:uncharacterized protein LOC132936367 n=1 Tax=Metopolophium dirhodum TaxID=44670 RepID=UPI00299033EB|nr:uncharacterized protein LOC132936367 [Metopolophium dirhodum]XP_060859070.1 uncharacterized protein LOC132936367 [Metopolophium dirhodum]XP_060859071.1 uncharacterized protein LOC132936367 [Metopolophium dirhodum]